MNLTKYVQLDLTAEGTAISEMNQVCALLFCASTFAHAGVSAESNCFSLSSLFCGPVQKLHHIWSLLWSSPVLPWHSVPGVTDRLCCVIACYTYLFSLDSMLHEGRGLSYPGYLVIPQAMPNDTERMGHQFGHLSWKKHQKACTWCFSVSVQQAQTWSQYVHFFTRDTLGLLGSEPKWLSYNVCWIFWTWDVFLLFPFLPFYSAFL